MVNSRMQNQVLSIVDNQMKMGNPKCTNETVKKLKDLGYSNLESKKMIASILLEDIYNILNNEIQFDENIYCRKLSKLVKSNEGKVQQRNITISNDEIISNLEFFNGQFPYESLEIAIKNKETIKDKLLYILLDVSQNTEDYLENKDYNGHMFAIYLLAQFREKRAYSIIYDIVTKSGDIPFQILGDVITRDLGRILASVCNEDISLIKKLIENEEVDEYVRASSIHALVVLYVEGKLNRNEIINYFKELFETKIEKNYSYIWSGLVSYCCDIYPEELYNYIMIAYDNGLIDQFCIGKESFDYAMSKGKSKVLADLNNTLSNRMINDTISELEKWHCFSNDYYREQDSIKNYDGFIDDLNTSNTYVREGRKIGRNETCPCGSGKKYKKCCEQS